jgi:hypothetical protein
MMPRDETRERCVHRATATAWRGEQCMHYVDHGGCCETVPPVVDGKTWKHGHMWWPETNR